MRPLGARILVQLCAAGFALLSPGVAPAQEEDRPKIFLEKKIFSEDRGGQKRFYEVHTVGQGENLWKILSRETGPSASDYAARLKEFKRINPEVKDPGHLRPGQRILVPKEAGAPARAREVPGKSEAYRVAKGDRLSRILTARGVSRTEMPRYLDAVKELNEEIRDINRIYAGSTILLPAEGYFSEEAAAPVVALTKDAPPVEVPDGVPAARPEAQLKAAAPAPPGAPGTRAAPDAAPAPPPASAAPERPKPPYRGLLTDLLAGLGEKWIDRGTLYLPISSGGEVILNMEDFPVARFGNGRHVLVDFRGGLTSSVRSLITDTWRNYRVVSMADARDAGEMIDRLLGASGYHSVTDGLAHPLVIGEGVSVTLPARWVVLRTPGSLLSGEVILVKEVRERPADEMAAVLRYAGRVGIRVLPYAVDASALEGYLVGLENGDDPEPPAAVTIPAGGLPAVDAALDFLGIAKAGGDRLSLGGQGSAFQLVIQPERVFEAGGKRHVVDTGKMSPALRTLVRDSGLSVFAVGKDEEGSGIFLRVLKAAGIPAEERRGFLLSGGENAGYEVRVTGAFPTSKAWLEERKRRAAVLVKGKVHDATRRLMRDLGVEIVGR